MATFYIKLGDDESSEEPVEVGSDGWVSVTDETLVWTDHLPDWMPWAELKDSEYVSSGGESGKEPPGCSALYYEGSEDEVSKDEALALVEAGTITDETMVWSDQPAWSFEGWTAWWEAAWLFGVGERPESGCTALYYEGNDEEVSKADALALVEAGTIEDETMCWSDQPAWEEAGLDGWAPWWECSWLFGVGEPPGECTSLYTE